MMEKKLTHTNKNGKANMVDVSDKEISIRTAEAYSEVKISDEVFNVNAIKDNNIKKGDVLTVAKIAGIQAAKKTAELIPLCHNIFITKIDIELKLNEEKKRVEIKSIAKTIEMEALTAASVAALTVYDMCKAIDKSMVISETKLISKTGGKSGTYKISNSNNY